MSPMRNQYRVVIIGGGIVGASVAYHLALRGITDVLLVERDRLTAGSSWHAAGGFHAINPDRRVAELQRYTIERYPLIEAESGQALGLKMSGGVELAATADRFRWLHAERSHLRARGHQGAELLTPSEVADLVPIINPDGLHGALFDPDEGNLDPVGAVMAYAGAAKARGVEIVQGNRVTALAPRTEGGWTVATEQGDITCEHVVNAAGLWARRVGRMAGVEHPVVPFAHHYMVTDEIPAIAARPGLMPAVTDLEGCTYLHREGNGVVLGVYEKDIAHWATDGAPWDFGQQLLPEDDRPDRARARSSPSTASRRSARRGSSAGSVGRSRQPRTGIRSLAPSTAGQATGRRAACSPGSASARASASWLANWIVDGEPGLDAFGMDPARFADWAAEDSYLLPMTAQFISRRFTIAYPNETLPATRPLHTTPAFEALTVAGASFGVNWGLETARFLSTDPGFEEAATFGRSNASRFVADEVAAVRTAAGIVEIAQYARYLVEGPGAGTWLDGLVAGRLPALGRIRLAPMLGRTGRLMGDLSLARIAPERFIITASYHLQAWHMRWFHAHLPASGVRVTNLTDSLSGFALAGPASRDVLAALVAAADRDAAVALPLFGITGLRIPAAGGVIADVGRIGLTGRAGLRAGRAGRPPSRAATRPSWRPARPTASASTATSPSTCCASSGDTASGPPSSGGT